MAGPDEPFIGRGRGMTMFGVVRVEDSCCSHVCLKDQREQITLMLLMDCPEACQSSSYKGHQANLPTVTSTQSSIINEEGCQCKQTHRTTLFHVIVSYC